MILRSGTAEPDDPVESDRTFGNRYNCKVGFSFGDPLGSDRLHTGSYLLPGVPS
jgi:hypothetical protein